MKLKLNDPGAIVIAALISGICVLIAAVPTGIALIPAFGEWLFPRDSSSGSTPAIPATVDSPTPTFTTSTHTPTDTPTSEPSATSMPTDASTPILTVVETDTPTREPLSQPVIPLGYEIFDSFDEGGELDDRWHTYGDLDFCSGKQEEGFLSIQCHHTVEQDVRLGLTPHGDDPTFVQGVAMAAQVLNPEYENWGSIILLVHFGEDGGDSSIRTYHISLRGAIARVIEMYPQDGWRQVTLAEIEIPEVRMHIVRIEYTLGSIVFFIDGEAIDLEKQPSLPADSTWRNWMIEGSVFAQQEEASLVLDTLVDWVAIKK